MQPCGLLNIMKSRPWHSGSLTARRAEEQRRSLPPRLLLAAHLFRASQSSRPTVNMAQHNRAQTNKKVTPAASRFLFSFCCQLLKPLQNIPSSPYCHYYYSTVQTAGLVPQHKCSFFPETDDWQMFFFFLLASLMVLLGSQSDLFSDCISFAIDPWFET